MLLKNIFILFSIIHVTGAFALEDQYKVNDSSGNLMCSWHQTSSKKECNDSYLKTSLQYQKLMEDNINSSKLKVEDRFKNKILARTGNSEEQLEKVLKAYCKYSLESYEDNSLLSEAQLREFVQMHLAKFGLSNSNFKLCDAESIDDNDSACRKKENRIPLPDWTSQSMDQGVWQKGFFWSNRQSKRDLKDHWEKRINKAVEVPDCESLNLEVYYKWACVAQYGLPSCFESEASSSFFNFFGNGAR
ncbi:MAG: hypothetical protein VX583_03190 [Bdellovibrionota bacterium]